MSRSRSKKSKAAQTPLFIEKLIDMLEDSSINHIISWTSSNDSFHIKSISQFTETVLPRFFKHNNFSSFIRQLNMYGFRKIRHEDGENVYENESFKRGNRALLKNIKRKVNLQREDRLALYAQDSHTSNNLSKQIQQMKTKQKDLQQICRHLLLQNHKLIEENNSLMKKMKDDERKKQRKIQKLLIAMIMANQNKQPAIGSGQGNQPMMMIQDSNNINNMLSLMTGDNSSDLNILNQKNQQTPLEVLTNALSRNKSMKQFKQMLEGYYSMGGKQKSENNPSNFADTRITRNRSTSSLLNSGNRTKNSINFTNHEQKSMDHHEHMREDESGFHLNNEPSEFSQQYVDPSHHNDPDSMRPPNEDDDGFICINDFMNLDEEDGNINLEESN